MRYAGIRKNFRNLFANWQQHSAKIISNASGAPRRRPRLKTVNIHPFTEGAMHFVAGALAVLSGLFYAADHHEIGSLGVAMCKYGSVFCDNPAYVFVGAVLAALWGTFVSVR
jgi:hypothetical protein